MWVYLYVIWAKNKGLTKLSRVLWALGEGVYLAHREQQFLIHNPEL